MALFYQRYNTCDKQPGKSDAETVCCDGTRQTGSWLSCRSRELINGGGTPGLARTEHGGRKLRMIRTVSEMHGLETDGGTSGIGDALFALLVAFQSVGRIDMERRLGGIDEHLAASLLVCKCGL